MKKRIEEMKSQAASLEALQQEFDDLESFHGRWETVLVSKHVVPDKVELKYSCGCCGDATLNAWFYVKWQGDLVYSNPPYICIGNKNEGKDNPYDILDIDWRKTVSEKFGEHSLALLDNIVGDNYCLKPIASDEQLDLATGIVDELLDKSTRSIHEEAYLDKIGDLIWEFEETQSLDLDVNHGVS